SVAPHGCGDNCTVQLSPRLTLSPENWSNQAIEGPHQRILYCQRIEGRSGPVSDRRSSANRRAETDPEWSPTSFNGGHRNGLNATRPGRGCCAYALPRRIAGARADSVRYPFDNPLQHRPCLRRRIRGLNHSNPRGPWRGEQVECRTWRSKSER